MHQSITFITDVREGEPDILSAVSGKPLSIRDENGVIAEHPAPADGWTHDALEAKAWVATESAVEAYLGEVWVGSSEV
jgi:hypothetical protein